MHACHAPSRSHARAMLTSHARAMHPHLRVPVLSHVGPAGGICMSTSCMPRPHLSVAVFTPPDSGALCRPVVFTTSCMSAEAPSDSYAKSRLAVGVGVGRSWLGRAACG